MKKAKIIKNAVLVGLGLIFIPLYSLLILNNPNHRFSWPDEMANYYFTQSFAAEGVLKSEEPLNLIAGDLILPRSLKIVNHDLAPVGFLGLPIIYGVIAAFVPDWWIVFLTPILAFFSAVGMCKIISLVRNEREGIIGGLLMLIMPAFAYYANFSMLPNVPMIFFFIWGSYFLIRAINSVQRWSLFMFSGLLFGLGLMIRPVEALWIIPIILVIALSWRKKIKLRYFVYWSLVIGFCALVYLYFNNQTYTQVLESGYSLESKSPLSLIFPFGVSLKTIYHNLTNFVLASQWYWVALTLVAVAYAYFSHSTKEIRAYVLIWAATSIFLILMYCSWQLPDTFVLAHSKIGVSFTRYLLPVFVGAIPMVAIFIAKSFELYKKSTLVGLTLIVVLSINTLYFSGNDNLLKIKASINELNELHEKIIYSTAENAVIISKRGDKAIFPEREVISQYSPDEVFKITNLLRSSVPVNYLVYKEEKVEIGNLKLVNPEPVGYDYILYDVVE